MQLMMSGKFNTTSCGNLSRYCHSLDLQSIWNNLEARFQIYGPDVQFFH